MKKKTNIRPRRVGEKTTRGQQWEDLHEAIVDCHAGRFNQILGDLMDSDDLDEKVKGAEMFIKVLEFFKPKHQRMTHAGDKDAPIVIAIPDKI